VEGWSGRPRDAQRRKACSGAGRRGKTASNMTMLMALRRLGRGDLTSHGFRSTFRGWAGDATNFQREVIEAALAHAIGDATEAAYRRSDALDKRRRLMDALSAFTLTPAAGADVVQLRTKR
jgi:integrase